MERASGPACGPPKRTPLHCHNGQENQTALTKSLTFVVNSKGWHQIEAINPIESQRKSCQQSLLSKSLPIDSTYCAYAFALLGSKYIHLGHTGSNG
jgi:hypothetical protein